MKRITAAQDAYGREIWDYEHGKGSAIEIVERDDGLIDTAPSVASYFAGFSRWPRPQRQAMRFVRGTRALDVGCGAGRVALYLQDAGLRVTAIDNSPLAIRTARERGVNDARVLPFEEIFRLPANSFDAVVMFGNNFGLFGSFRRAKTLLRQLHRITRDDAVLLAESLNPHDTRDPLHLKYLRENRRRGRMSGQIRIRIRYGNRIGPWFNYLLVSPEEMVEILDGTGWTAERFFFDRGPRFVAVVTRTE